MGMGSIAAILLAVLSLAGLAVLLLTDEPAPPPPVDLGVPADPPAIEALCGAVALGGMPRVQMRSDTTVLILDLDGALYTMTQANLQLTASLCEARCRLDSTLSRPDGRLTFMAAYPDGKPLRIELKPVGST